MERHIPLDGCLNFRDLGGYPTVDGRRLRWRRLFRSDALHGLSAADVRRLERELEIETVVDLRSSAERDHDGEDPLADTRMRLHHLPLFDGDTRAASSQAQPIPLAERYFLLARFAQDALVRVVDVLAGSSGPALYHCAAGKDRTGVVSAILLGALGVPDAVIVADYAMSRRNLDAIVERLNASEGYRTMFEKLPPDTLHAEPETMEGLLSLLREHHGSVRGYLREGGLEEAALARLESALVE